MKQILTATAICMMIWLTVPISFAGPPGGGGAGRDFSNNGPQHLSFGDNSRQRGFDDGFQGSPFQDLQERRKQREERGFQRLQKLKWQPGYTIPQHYRGESYKVDYDTYRLPRPTRNQQWYKINNEYLLVDSDNNTIIQIR
ncbi:MAG: RcnB family protein [Acinetobacter sp.]